MMLHHLLQGLLQLIVNKGLTLLGSNPFQVNGAAVLSDRPSQLEAIQRYEEVLVINLQPAFLQALVRNPYVLIVVTYLVGMGIQPPVRRYNTVAVEIIVRSRIAPIVTSIGENLLTRNRTLVAQGLVDEVPDKATLILGILADEVPILLEATHRVAHSVRVLALDEGTRIVALRIVIAITVIVVHGAEDVCLAILSCLFVLYWT